MNLYLFSYFCLKSFVPLSSNSTDEILGGDPLRFVGQRNEKVLFIESEPSLIVDKALEYYMNKLIPHG